MQGVKGTTININGGVINQYDPTDPHCAAIYHPQKGTINISGGRITGSVGIQLCSGSLTTVNINGGIVTGTGKDLYLEKPEADGCIGDGAAISALDRNYPGGAPYVLSLIHISLANKGQKDKLTHSGLAGIDNTVKTMENFLGLDINYYARVNFTSLIQMVDALGGITINNDVAFTGYNGTYFAKGNISINGDEALEYSRERHAFGAGDNERVFHQQIVIMGMLNKMMSPAVITNYSSVLNAIEGCFETNMSSSEITSLIPVSYTHLQGRIFDEEA